MKTIITILLLLSPLMLAYGQKNVSKKIIGTWVGPSHQQYDSIKRKTVIYQDTLVFFKDNKYTWTYENQTGVWNIGDRSNSNEYSELRLSSYDFAFLVKQVKFGSEERHPFDIIKITRKRLKIKTFISHKDMSVIYWHEYEFTKI